MSGEEEEEEESLVVCEVVYVMLLLLFCVALLEVLHKALSSVCVFLCAYSVNSRLSLRKRKRFP